MENDEQAVRFYLEFIQCPNKKRPHFKQWKTDKIQQQ